LYGQFFNDGRRFLDYYWRRFLDDDGRRFLDYYWYRFLDRGWCYFNRRCRDGGRRRSGRPNSHDDTRA
jgi:hypothetical protein